MYVVDSATVARQIRDVAEYLFNILTSPRIHAIRYCFHAVVAPWGDVMVQWSNVMAHWKGGGGVLSGLTSVTPKLDSLVNEVIRSFSLNTLISVVDPE